MRLARVDYERLLDQLKCAESITEVHALIDQFRVRRRRRGAPRKPTIAYRALWRMWREFSHSNTHLFPEGSRRRFLRREARKLKALGLALDTPGSLEKAIGRGRKANAAARSRRAEVWRVFGAVGDGSVLGKRGLGLMPSVYRAMAEYEMRRLYGFTSLVGAVSSGRT
jgi:hypothetical protein